MSRAVELDRKDRCVILGYHEVEVRPQSEVEECGFDTRVLYRQHIRYAHLHVNRRTVCLANGRQSLMR